MDTNETLEGAPPAPRPRRLAERAQHMLPDWEASSADARERVETVVRARPVLSLAVALAAGFLLGRLLRD